MIFIASQLLFIISSIDGKNHHLQHTAHSHVHSHQHTNTHPYHICMKDESRYIAQYFHSLNFDHTNCPGDEWLSDMQRMDPDANKIMIDVGFNKGYNFAEWAYYWAPQLHVDYAKWHHILSKKHSDVCGNCNDCKRSFVDDIYKKSNYTTYKLQDLIMVGIDLNPAVVDLVEDTGKQLGFTKENGVHLHMHNAGGGATADKLHVLDCSINKGCQVFNSSSSDSTMVPVVTIDMLIDDIQKKIVPTVRKENIRSNFSVDILTLNADGYDPIILKGAMNSIRKGLIRILQFEYHAKCPWPNYSLKVIVYQLSRYSYACYMQGTQRLFKLTGGCWNDLYEIHNWGNVLCVRKTDIWYNVMEKYRVTSAVATQYLNSTYNLDTVYETDKPQHCTHLQT